jgi:hypothetical protein
VMLACGGDRAFVILVIMRTFGSCSRISLLVVGCWDISYDPVGMELRSGLIGRVVNVVCLGCHPRDCGVGKGGEVLTFLRIGALFVW